MSVSSLTNDNWSTWTEKKGFSVEGKWGWSYSLKGPYDKSPATLYSGEVGATAIWNPRLGSKTDVNIKVYKLVWPTAGDPRMKFDVYHNGKVSTVYVDATTGESGWVDLGTFDFGGTDDDLVKLTKISPNTNTRVSVMKFEMINPPFDKGLFQTKYFVNSDNNLNSKRLKAKVSFGDIKNHWAKTSIESMATKEYVKGINDQNFYPNDAMTRAQFVTIIARAMNVTEDKAISKFKDVGENNWFTGYIGAAYNAGLLNGFPDEDGKFYPDRNITREEMALIIYNATQNANKNIQWTKDMGNPYLKFIDKNTISGWAKKAVENVGLLGIMKGSTATTFSPLKHATRAEATVILKRYLETVVWSGPPTTAEWGLTFQDNFKGDSLDWNVWSAQNAYYKHILSGRWKENAVVQDGLLKLVVKKEKRGGAEWTAASVWVKREVFSQKYGYWEARYRYAPHTGLNQSFWNIEGGKFELDVNEGHYPNKVTSGYHKGGKYPKEAVSYETEVNLAEDFHTYGMEWDEDHVIFYFDGKEYGRFNTIAAHEATVPYLSLAVVTWAGPVLDAMSGSSMDVDWVRIYEKK